VNRLCRIGIGELRGRDEKNPDGSIRVDTQAGGTPTTVREIPMCCNIRTNGFNELGSGEQPKRYTFWTTTSSDSDSDSLTPHASRLTPHASRLTPHASRVAMVERQMKQPPCLSFLDNSTRRSCCRIHTNMRTIRMCSRL
jgi:hypothetical protein